jgi:hypothetical protein
MDKIISSFEMDMAKKNVNEKFDKRWHYYKMWV